MPATPPAQRPVPVIGVVGGIGSGKSTLARWVAEHHPVAIIDADRIGHQVLEDPAVAVRLQQEFGPAILDEAGRVVRSRLAAQVFGSSADHQTARLRLEAIVHPEIAREVKRLVAQVAPSRFQCVLLDAAVLLEADWRSQCDAVVFIDTPEARRREWVLDRRGWSGEELARREASQWPLGKKRAAADVVVANDGTVEEGGRRLWEAVQRLYEGK